LHFDELSNLKTLLLKFFSSAEILEFDDQEKPPKMSKTLFPLFTNSLKTMSDLEAFLLQTNEGECFQ
jgi:hypothetical protein